ncbi:MAG: helix-turn-helix domain-containing protein [Synergistaceae bacterium]|nr:helix-turn-helix domain-containing protein [Synergistaceae bacterium]
METLEKIVAENLKGLRTRRKLSLDKVSALTGVSKSMLGQVERGESSPTLQTVWKIANGLRIPLSELTDAPVPETESFSKDRVAPILGDNGRFRVYPIFPYDGRNRFEFLSIEMDRGAFSSSEPHIDGTVEYVHVFEGEIVIMAGDEERCLGCGDSMKYRADRPHSYHNPGEGRSTLAMVILYPEENV